MKEILQTALAGTARREAPSSDAPPDALVQELHEPETERALLLRAGAWSVYGQAGAVARPGRSLPNPAPPDDRPACNARAVQLVDELLTGQQEDLLLEALVRLKAEGLRLPPALLPAALSVRREEVRAAVLPVIGERGRWLSRFNSEWSWVDDLLPATGAAVADAEARWQEGTRTQRLALVRGLRGREPAAARALIESAWRQEKAEFRRELLETLATGLSSADEPFLETALDDRAPSVRTQAATLLTRIPGSALNGRMRERADALLAYEPTPVGSRLRALMRSVLPRESVGTLAVTLPPPPDTVAQRDGVLPKPPLGLGEGAWWLTQMLALVPPAHWEQRFGAAPDELIAAGKRSEWVAPLMEGWSRAAVLHGAAGWAAPLWTWWHALDPQNTYYTAVRQEMIGQLLEKLPQPDAEHLCERLLSRGQMPADEPWDAVMRALPRPWSPRLADRYLETLRSEIRKGWSQSFHEDSGWRSTLVHAARALPPEVLPRALDEWSDVEAYRGDWQMRRFVETVHLRYRIYKEIES